MHLALRVASFMIAAAMGTATPAQTYPTKPVRFIAPFPPGGTSDIIARVAAQKLTDALGKQVLIDNRGGASGTIGYDIGAKAPADGYTLILTTELVKTGAKRMGAVVKAAGIQPE